MTFSLGAAGTGVPMPFLVLLAVFGLVLGAFLSAGEEAASRVRKSVV